MQPAFPFPGGVLRIIQTLEAQGFSAYAVGGCVRDLLLGRSPHDWDLCTAARPDQIRRCFSNTPILDTGAQHGTVTIVLDGIPYEVTSYRVDGSSSDHRRPDGVRFTAVLEEDLARRDFTMNAMALHPDGRLVDPFGGQADLQAGLIRCVGEPVRRFTEDALRILRALRFSAQLGFVLEAETAAGLLRTRTLLACVSPERKGQELAALLTGRAAAPVLTRFADVFCQLLPLLSAAGTGALQQAARRIAHSPPDLCLRLALLPPGGGAEMAAGLRENLDRLRFPRRTTEAAAQLALYRDSFLPPTLPQTRRWFGRLGAQQLLRLVQSQEADAAVRADVRRLQALRQVRNCIGQIQAEGLACRVSELAIGGRDLLALGIPPGPQLGRLLERLLDAVIEGRLENRAGPLLAWVSAQRPPG